jgi:hypothetical protein
LKKKSEKEKNKCINLIIRQKEEERKKIEVMKIERKEEETTTKNTQNNGKCEYIQCFILKMN